MERWIALSIVALATYLLRPPHGFSIAMANPFAPILTMDKLSRTGLT